MMHRGTNMAEVIKELGQRGLDGVQVAMTGTITSVDPQKMMAKVLLGILGTETGWLPVGTMLAGNGYGVVALPEDDTEVTVIFDNGDINSGKIILCNFNNHDSPPEGMKPGEIFASSKGGASIKLDKSGQIIFNGGTKGVARVGDEVQISGTTSDGASFNATGKITTGSLNVLA